MRRKISSIAAVSNSRRSTKSAMSFENTLRVNSGPAHAMVSGLRISFPLGNLKPIPSSSHSFQIPRVLWVDLDFLTDTAHVYVHRPGRDKARIPPNRVQQVIPAEH